MLDNADEIILNVLSKNGRASIKVLAAHAGLSSPSTSERLRRLEDRGIILRYRAEIDPGAIGLPIQALVRIKPLPGRVADVQKLIAQRPEVAECDKVTGDDCFVARVFVRSMEHLDEVVDSIAVDAATSTSIVKSQVVQRRVPLAAAAPE